MSALEEYRTWDAATIIGPQANLIKAQADAAIAELETEARICRAYVRTFRARFMRCPAWNIISIRATREFKAILDEDES